MDDANNQPPTYPQLTTMYQMLDEEERKIVNSLAIKKLICGNISAHDVTMAFVAKKKINNMIEIDDPSIAGLTDKFEMMLQA